MTPESQPTATHPAPASEPARIPPPTVADLTEALVLFVETGSKSGRAHVRRLVASLVDRGLGPADCAGAFWDALGPLLLSASDQERPVRLQRILAAETELWRLLDRAYRLERRAHRQMASAYTRKNLEISRILDSLPAYAFAKDAQSRYTAVNTSFCEALGLPRERILSRTDEDLFPPEIAHELSERDQEVLRSKVALRQEATTELNGEQHTLLITKAPLIDPDGRVTGLVGIGVDITQRIRIEREHSRLAAAVEATSDSIFITDAEGTIQFVNAGFEKLSQYSRDEIIGKKVGILRSEVHDASFFEQMWSQLTAGGVWRGILSSRRKDGSTFEADQTTAPLQDEEGRISGYVTVARDVTEHKKLLDTLQRAVLVKSDFTSMVSHELRTPLCAIKEAIDLVEDGSAGPLNDHQTQFLGLAKRNVDRLHRLINDVLDFSRMERGAFRMHIAPHDLNAVISEIVTQQRLAAHKQGIALTFDSGRDIDRVPFDPDRLSQVLVNLIGNAIRYCTGAWVRVSSLKRDDEVIVTTRDSGPGIPAEHLQNIFNPFVQLSSGIGRKAGGTGLGLAISRRIIEAHGGRIWVESKVDEGSAFSIALPLHLQEEDH